MSAASSETLTGVVERLTFQSEEGYSVVRLKVAKFIDLVTVVGSFANIQAGQTLQLKGYWREHPKYGQQFQATDYRETKPATLTGIEKYLGSGLIKGVGPVTAQRIVARFGLETLEIIEQDLDRLIEVSGIGRKRVQRIREAWEQQRAIKEVMVFLQSHGVSTTYAVKIYKQYKENAITTVTENPYQLAIDIYGIGFRTADQIAQNLGVSPWSKSRYQAGLLHILGEAAESGHCFLPQPELINLAAQCLTSEEHEPESDAIASVIAYMEQERELVVETAEGEMRLCYKPTFFFTERNLANRLSQQFSGSIDCDLPRVRHWLKRYTSSRQIELSLQQQQAVERAAQSQLMILTGGPGCGKTFCTRTIVALWKAMGKTIALAAPTGRAAQRLGEMAGMEAKTLHRLLEFDPRTQGFKRNEENPLDCQAVVVDEASMLDLFLAHSLFKALPKQAQVLLVGDTDQLPSVGPGSVLKDLIDSKGFPVICLTQVFRQAAQSGIIRAAHQINQGQFPQLEAISDQPQSDCLWHSGGYEPEHGVQALGEILSDLIARLGFNPATDVQVLCPMTRGTVGTRNLNQVLQQLLNPPHPERAEMVRGSFVLRVGDRVIQQKNNYDYGVFNGDLGIICAIDRVEQKVTVAFDGREVNYDYADLNELALAWAITIHKSQGSEYPVVILPLYLQHYPMLSRNLFYTGLTRGKKLVIVIGSRKAIAIAVNQLKEQRRYTRLAERLLKR